MYLKTTLRASLVFAALFFLADQAAACSCHGLRQDPGFHPCMAYSRADVIFKGLVTDVSLADPAAPFSNNVVRFSVDEAYKGIQGSTVEITTSSSTTSCGYPFTQGQRFFVYARREKSGKLTAHLCDPTVPLELAARDLAYAQEAMTGKAGERIVGAIIKHERRDVKDYGTKVPIRGVKVILERYGEPDELSQTVTNEEGRYEFRLATPGAYHIRAELPSGVREFTTDGKPKDHFVMVHSGLCGSVSFIVTTDSSIRGRLVTPDASSLPQQYLALVPLDDSANEISSSLTPGVGSMAGSGDYYFHDVPPGRYLLAVNARNKPGKSDPTYPLMYYPGVMSRQQATVIRVTQTREIILDHFKLTPPLKERWFSGTVLLADKSPAAGAKVILIDPNDRMTDTNVTQVIAGADGTFRVKGYETFPYWIDAYIDLKLETERGPIQYAAPVKLSTSGSVEGIELVISLSYRSQPYHNRP